MKRKVFSLLLIFIPLFALCQDFDQIFQDLPEPGAFVKYKYKNTKDDGEVTEGNLTVSVTGKEIIDGEECLLVEVYPFVFKALTLKQGTLGIFLKKNQSEQERKNFILRAKKVMFAQEGKEPYEVDESVLRMLREESKSFNYEKVEKEKERKIVEFKDKIKREVVVYDSKVVLNEGDGEKQKISGFKEFSKEIPFGVVKEEYVIQKIGKNGDVKKTIKSTIEIVDFSLTDAKSAFQGKKMKKKGFWGIIFS